MSHCSGQNQKNVWIKENDNIRSYHHVKLDREFKEDARIWLSFLTMNDCTSISRPFLDLKEDMPWQTSGQILFHSDDTANELLGLGFLFNENWTWEPGFIRRLNPNIEFLELYAVAMGIFILSEELANKSSMVFCDNSSVVGMLNKSSSGCKYCMMLIRKITLRSLNYNFRIFRKHVKGTDNFLADNLSRMRINLFKKQVKKAKRIISPNPSLLKSELWPLSAFWQNNCAELN